MTSAANDPSAMSVAVRQAPLTATESPLLELLRQLRLHPQVSPVGVAVEALDLAQLTHDAREHAYHSRSRARTSRSSPERSQSIASARSAAATRSAPSPKSSGPRALAAEQQRSDEEAKLIELAGVEERAGKLGAALEQDRRHLTPSQLGERRADTLIAVAGEQQHVGAGVAQRGHARIGRRWRRRR